MSIRLVKWQVVAWSLLGSLLGAPPATLAQQAASPLQVTDCVRLIRPDSIHLYFDNDFALTPPACATIRRECRMDAATGNFAGPVRDYSQLDNRLIYKSEYAKGQRNGYYEAYFKNQRPAVRGQYVNGKPSGIWQFWYEDGKPRQILEWTGSQNPRLRVLNYWDANGVQLVTEGEGIWRTVTTGPYAMSYGGQIVQGYQQGEWECHSQQNNGLLTLEEFHRGRFKSGQQFVAQSLQAVGEPLPTQTMQYTTRPSLTIDVADLSLRAEPLHLGKNCEQHAEEAQTMQLLVDAMKGTKGALVVQMPRPQQEPLAYQRGLLHQLRDNPALTQLLPQSNESQVIVLAEVDEQGRLHSITAENKELAALMATLLPAQGAWHPAMLGAKPMPGRIRFEISRHRKEWQCTIRTNLKIQLLSDTVYHSE